MKNYYEILGVSKDASNIEIRKKYRELVKKYHPDVYKEKDATAKIQEINEVYEVLSNEQKRREYDRSLNNRVNYYKENNNYQTDELGQLNYQISYLIRKLLMLDLQMGMSPYNVITLKEKKEIASEYTTIKAKIKHLRSTGYNSIYIQGEHELDNMYREFLEHRERHIQEFFKIYNTSKKGKLGIAAGENLLLTTLCVINGINTFLCFKDHTASNITLPTFVILTGINISLINFKQKINKTRFENCSMRLNKDKNLQEEYEDYCKKKKRF